MKKNLFTVFTIMLLIVMIPSFVKAKNVDKYAKDRKIVFKSIKHKNNDELMEKDMILVVIIY